MLTARQAEKLLREEIVRVAGCTEPASVAFAFLTARRYLKQKYGPLKVSATLTASSEVLRNASTAVVPFLNRRGLRAVVATGLSSKASGFNLFPKTDPRMVRRLLRRRSWLDVHRNGEKGVYVKAALSTPVESVAVVIAGRHNEIRSIERNGKSLVRSAPHRQPALSMRDILKIVEQRNRGLEAIARDFIIRQVRGNPAQTVPLRAAALIRARMLGSTSPVMTIVGSGNHGILLGVPFYDLYRKHGARVLPAALLSLLTVIHLTGKRSRISEECGLGTKAGPALAAGLAYARGADLPEITRLMQWVSKRLRPLECHGARSSCGQKAEKVLATVLPAVTR